MSVPNEEELKELFERFVDAEGAERGAEDIRKGEQILREHPASEPGEELIGEIKAEVGRTLVSRKAFRRAVYRVAAAAAVFFVLAAIGVKLFEKQDGGRGEVVTASLIPTAIWESNDITADDEDLAALTAEVEAVEGELLAVRTGENGGNGAWELTELEIELMEINGDFWKG